MYKETISEKSGVIYRYKSRKVDCEDEYIGESRTVVERFKKHFKANSPIYDYYNTTGHATTVRSFSIV